MTDEFWDWLPKAYGEVGDEPSFTKYNMEVAFAAGAEAEAKRMWVGLTEPEHHDPIGDAQDKLIAEQAALAKADEREACAKVCDRFQARDVGMQPAECAAAIRARSNT